MEDFNIPNAKPTVVPTPRTGDASADPAADPKPAAPKPPTLAAVVDGAQPSDGLQEVQHYPKLEIKPGDLDRFFDCILEERAYTEEVKLYDGKMTVVLRTRTIKETNMVMARIGRDAPTSVAEMEMRLASYNLAMALVAVKTSKQVRNYDIDGDLSARLALQENIQAPHFLTLIQHMFAFDDKVSKLRESAVKKTS